MTNNDVNEVKFEEENNNENLVSANPYGVKCPYCGSTDVKGDVFGSGLVLYYCNNCDSEFDLEPKR